MLAKAANTIQKVEATQENGIVTVPAGYISEEQTFVVGSEFSAGYLINNDDGSVYFQKVKVVDGETVNDGDPVQITGVSIPETGVAEPDYAQGGGGDVTLGQIDADGNFQPLAFDGTESSNDGDPETVDSYYGWNGTLPVPDNGIKVGEAAEYYKCASVDTTAKTWTGYKAVLTNGVYTFEETVTAGLTYGLVVPEVGGIYTDGTLVRVASLVQGKPTDYVFFNSLSDAEGWTMEGATVVQDDNRSVFQTVNDGSGGQYAVISTDPGVPLGFSPRTLSFWFKRTSVNGSCWCGIGYGSSYLNNRIAWGLVNDYPGVTYWANDYFQSEYGFVQDTEWHHYVVTYDGSVTKCYADGVLLWAWNTGEVGTDWQYINIGDPWEGYQSNGRYADYYIFNRVLENSEIQQLYAERTV